jgi:colicin import membrane protein
MPPRIPLPTTYRRSDGFVSFVLSVLLHGGIVLMLAYGWFLFQRPPIEQSLAIEATAIDARSVSGLLRSIPRPEPPPPAPVEPPPEPQGPPQPTPEEIAQREQAAKEQAEREAQQKAEEEHQRQVAQQKAAEEQAAREKQAVEERKAEEARLAQQKADEERKAKEAAEAQKKAEAEKQRLAELKRQQEEQQRKQDEQAKAEREAELKRSLAQDEQESREAEARTSSQLAAWTASIRNKIERAWIRPPSAHPGLHCELHVTQESGGVVSRVTMGDCNGDQAVRESIQQAVYRVSPLPAPPDPSLFNQGRTLIIDFSPRDPQQ